MIGRGYEYMDLEPEPTVTASERDSGPLGFAGSAARESGAEPAGLATLTRDQFGGSSTVPMLPGTWNTRPRLRPTGGHVAVACTHGGFRSALVWAARARDFCSR